MTRHRPPYHHRDHNRRRRRPRGVTLYEVLLALAIFLPAMVVLGECLSQGSRAALRSQLQTEAIIRCESVLAELIAGVRPLQAATGLPFEDGAPGWTWSAEILPGPHPDLLLVEVTVEHLNMADEINASWSINRLVRDPQLFLDAAAQSALEAGL